MLIQNVGLLDMSDPNLNFIIRWDGLAKPLAIFRIQDGEFLLCYNGDIILLMIRIWIFCRSIW